VEKYIDIPGVREKIKNKTKKNNYDKIVKINQYKPLFSKDDILKRNEFKFECVTCGNHISANENFSIKTIRCLNCFPIFYNTSNMEKELADFCKQYFPNLNENDRTLIKPYELDIVIPELKLAIEFNR
jgi:ribosomal protein L44E